MMGACLEHYCSGCGCEQPTISVLIEHERTCSVALRDRIADLEAKLAEAEVTIAGLRSQLADAMLLEEAAERERDEAKRVAVWAVRNQVEALGIEPKVDIFVFGRHRSRCDGTHAGIIAALERVMLAEDI